MKYLLLSLALFFCVTLGAQNPVSWSYTTEKVSETEYNLIFTATVQDGWSVYSQFTEEGGPVPTEFTFAEGDHFQRVGAAKELTKVKTVMDPLFGVNVSKFTKSPIKFSQGAIVKGDRAIEGYLTFMTCDDKTCLPPKDVDFSFTPLKDHPKVAVKPAKPAKPAVDKVVTTPSTKEQPKPRKQPATPKTKETDRSRAVSGTTTNSTNRNSQGRGDDDAEEKTVAETADENPDRPLPVVDDQQAYDLSGAVETGSEYVNNVTWTFLTKPVDEDEYLLIYKGVADEGWTLYSPLTPEGGPVATEPTYEEGVHFETVGDLRERGKMKQALDPLFGVEVMKYPEGKMTLVQRVRANNDAKPVAGYITFMTCDDETCLPPMDVDFSFVLNESAAISTVTIPTDDPNLKGTFSSKRPIDAAAAVGECAAPIAKTTGLWKIFLLGFGGGLLALLTPCVFPMIPLTVSFFTNRSKNRTTGIRNAIIYGLSIIAIYCAIGVGLTTIFGPTILNKMSTDMYFNLAFFLIFVVFALSFFGLFEIRLPSSWVNKSDQMADKGGLLGIFFMAFTLSLVSFSCTGPIIGTLLVETASGSTATILGRVPVEPLLGMLGFSTALALPFGLFAAFPAWLNSLPKSGGWMQDVKVTLGFVELALALKFFSVADMVRHWEILKFELFVALWIICALGLALYMFGILKFNRPASMRKVGIGKGVIGLASLAFAVYLGIGLFNYQPMSLMSGLAPPVHYNFFRPMDCPHGLDCYKDFDEAVTAAKEQDKPLFVDFTGYGCVNCRKVEETIWTDAEIIRHLREDFVVVSLYVDDQKRLFPEDKMAYILDENTGDKIRTIGGKWASFEVNNFGQSTQPLYVTMHHDGETVLTSPFSYPITTEEYDDFLECGLRAFERVNAGGTLSQK